MRVAINQSNYLPWKGYFDIINDVDLFIFYDDVQFTKNSWRNRNKIKAPTGAHWITVPVGDGIHRRICDVAIKDDRWQTKHAKTFRQLYGAARHFADYRAFLDRLYANERWDSLSRLNQFAITTIAREFLGIKARFATSSDFERSGSGQDAVLHLLNQVSADVYVSGPAGQAYLEPARFQAAGIRIEWKDYAGYPEYAQSHPPFDHNVTILDLLFHIGQEAPEYIWGWRNKRPAQQRSGKAT
jgi:hypothetical protein